MSDQAWTVIQTIGVALVVAVEHYMTRRHVEATLDRRRQRVADEEAKRDG